MSDWQLATLVVAFVSWLAQPASLGDVARREALRRQMTPKSTRVLTNQDVALVAPRPLPTLPPSAVEAKVDAKDKDDKGAKQAEGKDAETKDASTDKSSAS